MKAHTYSMICITGLFFMIGCKEDPVGPQAQGTYETAVFGTFRGFIAYYYKEDTKMGGTLCLDTASFLRIEKSGRYTIKLYGTDNYTRELSFSFEEVGHIQIGDFRYTPGVWYGEIDFYPDTAVNHSQWKMKCQVSDRSSNNDVLYASNGCSSIYLGQNPYLCLRMWRTLPYPCIPGLQK